MNPVIEVSDLQMRFRRCEALRGVDLSVPSGSVVAILGGNGAGKTTLIRILTGFQRPTAGACSVCGLDPVDDAVAVRRRVGYVSDAPSLYDWMGVAEIGWFAASFYGPGFQERYEQSIERFGLSPTHKIKHLSKGERAKVALSLAVAHDPELLIMDEPTSGLDPRVRRDFLESMIERAATGRTVFLSSHQIGEVERVADSVAILHGGRIRVHASLDELKRSVVELTIGTDDPLATLPAPSPPAELLSEQQEGRQRRWVVWNNEQAFPQTLRRRPGVTGVTERAMSLEEIFIAFTSDCGLSAETTRDRVVAADGEVGS